MGEIEITGFQGEYNFDNRVDMCEVATGICWYTYSPFRPGEYPTNYFTRNEYIAQKTGVRLEDWGAAAELAAQEAERQAEIEALRREQEQLQLKAGMLNSDTAIWSSQEAYNTEVQETTAEIQTYNAEVAAFLATAPQSDISNSGLDFNREKPADQPAAKSSNAGILVAGVGIAAIAAAVLIGGKK